MYFKLIFKGHFDFGKKRTFQKAYDMFVHKAESAFAGKVLLDVEEIFNEEKLTLSLPRIIKKGTKKTWQNTIQILEIIVQYALVGNVGAWMLDENKIIDQKFFEPKSEKGAIQFFLKGKSLAKEKGKEDEAINALSKAIDTYEGHSFAYERRGRVNLHLRNHGDAIYDFTKSISIDNSNYNSYLGRGLTHYANKDYQKAVDDFTMSIKHTIPLQYKYWTSRRLRSECNFKLEKYSDVIDDLKFFTKRNFDDKNPNLSWIKNSLVYYAYALLMTSDPESALENINKSLEMDYGKTNYEKYLPNTIKAVALKIIGKRGVAAEQKKAKELGADDSLFENLLNAVKQ